MSEQLFNKGSPHEVKNIFGNDFLVVKNRPPLGVDFRRLLNVLNLQRHINNSSCQETTPDQAITESHRFDLPYLIFTANRNVCLDYQLTGFEPYYIGQKLKDKVYSPDEIALTIARVGIDQLYNYSINVQQLINGWEELDLKQLTNFDFIMRSVIHSMREKMTPDAKKFQTHNKNRVSSKLSEVNKQRIEYSFTPEGDISEQHYLIPLPDEINPALGKPNLEISKFKNLPLEAIIRGLQGYLDNRKIAAHDYDNLEALKVGYSFMQMLGLAGHPIPRTLALLKEPYLVFENN